MTQKTNSKKAARASVYGDASPVERFKISEIAIKRMRKTQGAKGFEWAAFVALREQVAREMSRPPLHYRVAAWMYGKLGKFLEKNTPKR